MQKLFAIILALGLLAGLSACSKQRANTPSVKENVERSLDQAGLKDVKVSEDRDKGVVTLDGKVQSAEQKDQAGQAAKQAAGNMLGQDAQRHAGGQRAGSERQEAQVRRDGAHPSQHRAWVGHPHS